MKKETEAMRLAPGAPTDDAHRTAKEDVRPGAGGAEQDLMHRAMAWAVLELRRRLQWRQEDLAREINRFADELGRVRRPDRKDISRWENGEHAPASVYRRALGKIAQRHRYHDLAKMFRAGSDAWDLAVLANVALSRAPAPERTESDLPEESKAQ